MKAPEATHHIEGRPWCGNRPLAHAVLEHHGAAVPKGCEVHHRDGDPLNNHPGNLLVVHRRTHAILDGRRPGIVHDDLAIARARLLFNEGVPTAHIAASTGISFRHARHIGRNGDRRRDIIRRVDAGLPIPIQQDLFAGEGGAAWIA